MASIDNFYAIYLIFKFYFIRKGGNYYEYK